MPSLEAGIILIVVFSLMLISFLVEGFRLVAEPKPFADWAFVGSFLAQVYNEYGAAITCAYLVLLLLVFAYD